MTQRPQLDISILPGTMTICRMDPQADVPAWALASPFFSITRTPEELSIVCLESHVAAELPSDTGWRCLKVEGPLDLTLTGIFASLAVALAQAGISIFAISTYDTDALMVKQEKLEAAIQALTDAGYRFRNRS